MTQGMENKKVLEFISVITPYIESITNEVLPLQYSKQYKALMHIIDSLDNQVLLPDDLQAISEDKKAIIYAYKFLLPQGNESREYGRLFKQRLEAILSEIKKQQERVEQLHEISKNSKVRYEEKVQAFIKEDFEEEKKVIKNRVENEYDRKKYKTENYDQVKEPTFEQEKAYKEREEIVERAFKDEQKKWEQNEKEKYEDSLKLFNIDLQISEERGNENEYNKLVSEKEQVINNYIRKLEEKRKIETQYLQREQSDLRKGKESNVEENVLVKMG